MCPKIDKHCEKMEAIVQITREEGNTLELKDWGLSPDKVVYWMKLKLSKGAKDRINKNIKGVFYWSNPSAPFQPPEEGYVCEWCKATIVFPR